ncbi:concanavalin A-like lectin/glucanase domain-containing protein [Protomyces lactucae-debilis]|uniref:Crh-like protein n=1 Tax=Protomyces lactucae-debilis TaxID=2754530 RepID=A0A1Y2F486_PROLT|nr:concanavalin A-like lectin/glucanase domain-containing protein [Protomyces lactucae-debilis]ORY77755.1 concanavalin A-like lectin/glucanase domain-containing protein [Protomyces lactucae-debilis]
MLLNILLAAALAAACDPRTTSCASIPAMPASITYDLSTTNTAQFNFIIPNRITQNGNGLDFSTVQQGDAPTLVTRDYLLYGNVKAAIKTAPGVGMVSAFILMSDVLDEIDFEWLGNDQVQVQTNYFSRGVTANYDRGGFSSNPGNQASVHTYEIDWTETTLRWIIDGVTVRTLNKADTGSYGYPSTPSQIKIGVWASGDPSNEPGTIQWGGGLLDYSKGPYTMTLQSLTVTSYSPNAKSFSYAPGGLTFTSSNQQLAQSAVSAAATQQAAAKPTMAGQAIGVVAGASASTAKISSAPITAVTTRPQTSAAANTLRTSTAVVAVAATGTGVRTVTAASATASTRPTVSASLATSLDVRWVLATLASLCTFALL